MHDFNRTPIDIVKIVKIHESTLRKRLVEFGETPSSALTLDEFMTVDLEAEQDPPAFKLARKRDKERIQKLTENECEFNALTNEIDAALEKDMPNRRKRKATPSEPGDLESTDANTFIAESTVDVIRDCIVEDLDDPDDPVAEILKSPEGLRPDIAAMCVPVSLPLSKPDVSLV